MNSTRRNIWFPDDLWVRTKRKARKLGLTASELVRRAVESFLLEEGE